MEQAIAVEAMSDLVASIYDCAIDPNEWPRTLAALCEAMNFKSAALNLRSYPSGDILLLYTTGIEQHWLEKLHGYGAEALEQWGGIGKLLTYDPNQPALMSEKHKEGLTEASRIYVEWTRPRGMIDVMGVALARDGAAMGTIAFGRHRDAGPVTERDLSLARLLLPHLQRSVAISRLLDIGSIKSDMFQSVVDALSVGVVMTDASLKVIHANQVARRMLSMGAPVTAINGRLSVPSPGATAALSRAVIKAAMDEKSLGPNGFGVPLRLGDETHVFHVLPLRSGQLRPTVSVAADAAIFIAPSRQSPLWPELEIAALFDLTPAEARVFERISAGVSPGQIAAETGAAQSTIKTHLLQVFAKTGCHRQAELVALASSLKLPVW
jgi:DNA-binding CsgD family transcriptional regulator/PAS domain-containing protein